MITLRNLTIKRKLTLILTITSIVAVLLACVAFIALDALQQRRVHLRNLTILAEMVGNNCDAALIFDIPDDAEKVLSALSADNSIVFASIYDADGKVFAVYQRDQANGEFLPPGPQDDSHIYTGGFLQVFHRISLKNDIIGTIYIQDDMNEVYATLKWDMGILSLAMIISLIVAYLLASRLQALISEPILSLATTASHVSENKDYSIRADKSSEDEVGVLIESFNEMLAQIQIRDSALRKSEEKHRRLVDNLVGSFVYRHDTEGKFVYISRSIIDLLGYSEEDFMTHFTAYLTEHPVNQQVQEHTALSIQGIQQPPYEVQIYHKNGDVHWLEVAEVPVRDAAGKVLSVEGIAHDITDRKQTEEALIKSEEKYRLHFENASDVIYSLDPELRVTSISHSVERVLGYKPEELIGKSIQNLDLLTPECLETALSESERILAGNRIDSTEYKFFARDGTIKIGEVSGAPLSRDGKVIGIVSVARDITEKKEMEKKLIQSEKLKSLGELAGGVAHDFNNVLAAILGNAQLLKMNLTPPEGVEEKRKAMHELEHGLAIIEKAAKDGAETVRRIQEFARKREDDKYFTKVDLNEIVDNALEFTRMKWKDDAEAKGIKIAIKKELSTLPATSGSASELREVFTNLINNAVDAMPQGGEIRIKTYEEENQIIITVVDTGSGIPKSLRDRIFDPFLTTKGVHSTGLGLSVSYGIITRHRGTISVDSSEGEGTIFTITLPISEKLIEEEKVKPVTSEAKKVKILVIEDEEQVRNLLSAILTKGGHQLEIATDGSQGIEIFKKKEFDLVFTDLGMPGMSGWQVAEKIKHINGSVPVVLITGWNIELKESEVKDKRVDLIIHKPFEVNQVLNVVQEGIILRDRFKEA